MHINLVTWFKKRYFQKYKKVSYCKQTAHQHLCHKFLARTGSVVDPVNIFFSPFWSPCKISLLCRTVWAYVGRHKKFGCARAPLPCYHTKLGQSISNRMGIGGIPNNFGDTVVQPVWWPQRNMPLPTHYRVEFGHCKQGCLTARVLWRKLHIWKARPLVSYQRRNFFRLWWHLRVVYSGALPPCSIFGP